MIAAISIDGYISKNKNNVPGWTSKEDWVQFQAVLDSCDAVVMGRNTYNAVKKHAQKRRVYVFLREKSSHSNLVTYIDPKRDDVRLILSRHKRTAILGGTGVYAYFLKHSLIDRALITIEPLFLGGGIPFVLGTLTKKMRLVRSQVLNKQGSLLLEYVPA